VIREAFAVAQKNGELYVANWKVSLVALIAGDISRHSLAEGREASKPMYARLLRLTNYSNRHDKVLMASNVKRLGVSPRLGRLGLPADAPGTVVNVDCVAYFAQLDPKSQPVFGIFRHSWHIGNPVFTRDLATPSGVLPWRSYCFLLGCGCTLHPISHCWAWCKEKADALQTVPQITQ